MSRTKLQLGGCDLDARTHRGSDGAASDILTLCSGGLCLDDGAHQSIEVLNELFGAEGCLADRAGDDVGLVETVVDLTGRCRAEERWRRGPADQRDGSQRRA